MRCRGFVVLLAVAVVVAVSCAPPDDGDAVGSREPSTQDVSHRYECVDLLPKEDGSRPQASKGLEDMDESSELREAFESEFSGFDWTPDCVFVLIGLYALAGADLDMRAGASDIQACAETTQFIKLLRDKVRSWPSEAEMWIDKALTASITYGEQCTEVDDEELARRDTSFTALKCVHLKLAKDFPDDEGLQEEARSAEEYDGYAGLVEAATRSLADCDELP